MQPTFDMLCLTCPCHHRNDQLSASWQDYLDTSWELPRLYPIFGGALGPHPGIREIREIPRCLLALGAAFVLVGADFVEAVFYGGQLHLIPVWVTTFVKVGEVLFG